MRFALKCNICTYGPLHILTVSLAFAAAVLTYYSTFDCHFLDTTTKMAAFEQIKPEFGLHRGVGVWTAEVDGTCKGWPSDEQIDGPTGMARIFSTVACLFSLLLLIMLMVPCFSIVGGTAYMKKLGQFLVLIGVLHSFSFMILLADICTGVTVCELDSTSYVSISASATWMVASFLAFLVRAKPVESVVSRRPKSPSDHTPEGSTQNNEVIIILEDQSSADP